MGQDSCSRCVCCISCPAFPRVSALHAYSGLHSPSPFILAATPLGSCSQLALPFPPTHDSGYRCNVVVCMYRYCSTRCFSSMDIVQTESKPFQPPPTAKGFILFYSVDVCVWAWVHGLFGFV
eukprot:m.168986 g.168986  ORF g.168986 m.168986 type:complete len:122 (-) comp14492_c1_seq2:4506-4871(-)